MRFHDLRHTFATMALENDMDIKTLSAMIGHISTETTMNVYAHATEEMQRAAARKIDEAIGKALGGDKPRAELSSDAEAKLTAQAEKTRLWQNLKPTRARKESPAKAVSPR